MTLHQIGSLGAAAHTAAAAAAAGTGNDVIVRGGARDLVAQDAADAADRRNVVLVAHGVGQQLVAYFPREDARVLLLVSPDRVDDSTGGNARLAAADRARQDGPGVVIARQDFAHASVRHLRITSATRSLSLSRNGNYFKIPVSTWDPLVRHLPEKRNCINIRAQLIEISCGKTGKEKVKTKTQQSLSLAEVKIITTGVIITEFAFYNVTFYVFRTHIIKQPFQQTFYCANV